MNPTIETILPLTTLTLSDYGTTALTGLPIYGTFCAICMALYCLVTESNFFKSWVVALPATIVLCLLTPLITHTLTNWNVETARTQLQFVQEAKATITSVHQRTKDDYFIYTAEIQEHLLGQPVLGKKGFFILTKNQIKLLQKEVFSPQGISLL